MQTRHLTPRLHFSTSRKLFLALVAACLIVALLGISPQQVHAAGIVVNTTTDGVASDGFCSLTEAINSANSDASTSECPAGSGADTITFSVTGPITVAGTLSIRT